MSLSNAAMLLGAAAFGGYAYHLHRGGREFAGEMRDGSRRARAWVWWAAAALAATITGFTYPVALLVAIPLALYSAYLFSGGRDLTREGADGRGRSLVWLYYTAIAIGGVVLGFSHPAGFGVAGLAGLYAAYLFRGGRWIVWIW